MSMSSLLRHWFHQNTDCSILNHSMSSTVIYIFILLLLASWEIFGYMSAVAYCTAHNGFNPLPLPCHYSSDLYMWKWLGPTQKKNLNQHKSKLLLKCFRKFQFQLAAEGAPSPAPSPASLKEDLKRACFHFKKCPKASGKRGSFMIIYAHGWRSSLQTNRSVYKKKTPR